ncbi:MAG TPA: molecular chaperone DnaJ [Candidatus Paceibacterota bacterium]
MAKDYYEILGINKNASKDDIKKAFRNLAHQYHPDKKGGNEKKFKEANEAYSVLSDDKKRAEYDSYGRVFSGGPSTGSGQAGFDGFDFSNFSGEGFGNANFDFGDINIGEIFGDFFGRGANVRRERGHDISIDLEISFAESVFGVERKIFLTKAGVCDVCKGIGAKPGVGEKTCSACNGKGKFHETKRSFLGSFTSVRTCSTCRGTGKVPEEKCSQCRGLGVLRKESEIVVNIPSGISDGEVIRLTGAGEAIAGGAPGDLYAKIYVKKHSLFHKEGNNLVTDLKIRLSTALLGGEYNLKTLDGDIVVKVPAGVSFGEILRVRGKGVPMDRGGKRGDLMIRVKIELPAHLSKDAAELVEKLKEKGI